MGKMQDTLEAMVDDSDEVEIFLVVMLTMFGEKKSLSIDDITNLNEVSCGDTVERNDVRAAVGLLNGNRMLRTVGTSSRPRYLLKKNVRKFIKTTMQKILSPTRSESDSVVSSGETIQ